MCEKTSLLLQVCNQWKAVVEGFAMLEYLVWLGICGHHMPPPDAPIFTNSERLDKLHQYEREWEAFAFSRQDTAKHGVELGVLGCALATVGGNLLRCTLLSQETPSPLTIQESP